MDLSLYEDLHTDVMGKYLGADANINKYSVGASTKFVFPYINIPQCRHYVAFTALV